MKKWRDWFDPSDTLETTLTFLLCLPFLFLVTPPLLAAQVPGGFVPLTLLGWLVLPWASWQTARAAQRRSRCSGRRGFASLLLWIAISYSTIPLLLWVGGLFYQQADYAWSAGMLALCLLLLWESSRKWLAYAVRRPSRATVCPRDSRV